MLMTFKPPEKMTELGSRLLAAVREGASEWQTRNQIAERIGRPRLLPYDIVQLEYLASAGFIEVREGTHGVATKRFEYRVKPTE